MTGVSSPVRWRLGAVLEVIEETPHAKTIVLDVPDWPGHVAGQHVDIRLTAADGYQTERTYSIGSPPEQLTVELTVERIDDGEVSPYLPEELRAIVRVHDDGERRLHVACSVSRSLMRRNRSR